MKRALPEPFHIDLVLACVRGSSFGTPYYFVTQETLRRVVRLRDQAVAVDFTFDRAHREMRVNDVAAELASHLWGLSDDLTGCYETLGTDPLLRPLLARFAGLRLIRAASLFEALVSAILGQQISVASAQSMRRRLMEHLGDGVTIDGVVYVGYPTPPRLLAAGPDGLQALGVTRQKSRYLLAVAEHAAAGHLDHERFAGLDDAEAVSSLSAIPGVGRWTAEVALMYGLGRPDIFFAGDLALQVAVQRLLGLGARPSERELRVVSERWAGWRSYAALYLLMSLKHADER